MATDESDGSDEFQGTGYEYYLVGQVTLNTQFVQVFSHLLRKIHKLFLFGENVRKNVSLKSLKFSGGYRLNPS